MGLLIGSCGALLSGCSSRQEDAWPSDSRYKYVKGSMSDHQHNCYSYVFDYGDVKDPGEISSTSIFYYENGKKKISLNMLGNAVVADGIKSNKNIQAIPDGMLESFKTARPAGSYLVAAKISKGGDDYHFTVLDENGKWIDKPGKQESRYGMIDGFADTWQIDDITYSSDTLYFLYTP